MSTKEGTTLIIDQIIETIALLDKHSYGHPLELLGGASLGQHFRHIFDFYNCLLNALPEGPVNYSSRDRDPRIENDPAYASQIFSQVREKISSLDERAGILVVPDCSAESADATLQVSSSVGRELMYAYDHAIHHLAIIKIGLQTAFPGLQVDQNLGVAPSTIRYRNSAKA